MTSTSLKLQIMIKKKEDKVVASTQQPRGKKPSLTIQKKLRNKNKILLPTFNSFNDELVEDPEACIDYNMYEKGKVLAIVKFEESGHHAHGKIQKKVSNFVKDLPVILNSNFYDSVNPYSLWLCELDFNLDQGKHIGYYATPLRRI